MNKLLFLILFYVIINYRESNYDSLGVHLKYSNDSVEFIIHNLNENYYFYAVY